LRPGHRRSDAPVGVFSARLEHEDLVVGVGAEPLGDHRACRAGADHHIVGDRHRAGRTFIHIGPPSVRVAFVGYLAVQTSIKQFCPSNKYIGFVTEIAPLTPQEEAAWRALARAVLVIPRVLDAELLEAQGLNLTEYNVLMNLSEAPDQSLRMSELANFISI